MRKHSPAPDFLIIVPNSLKNTKQPFRDCKVKQHATHTYSSKHQPGTQKGKKGNELIQLMGIELVIVGVFLKVKRRV